MIIDQAKCQNCDEIIDVFDGEEVVFCPICEDTVFTQHHRVVPFELIMVDHSCYMPVGLRHG